ncbi:phosphatase PAP2 family protein [Desertimonas flava]|uniref:phosphatase PAP2 family protein n=1 Tax=Desertimonas flava TaxID=2064846 RepID=UPI0013C4C35F|nr:phosphatase PAP2 family protein [Desertimonas flava]
MPVTLAVVLAAVLTAAAVGAVSRTRRGPDPVDPAAEERWLVAWIGRRQRLKTLVRRLDREIVGGVMLVVALTVVFATALVVGLVFDMVDAESGLAAWDRSVSEWGSRHATERSVRILDHITDLGGTGVLTGAVIVVAAVDFARHRDRDVVLFLVVTLIGVVVVNNALKVLVGRERPPVEHLVGAAGASFPSGHSSAAAAAWFALALVVTRHQGRRRRAVAAGLAALVTVAVAASRVLLGVHWLTDVVAGVAVGYGWFVLSAVVFGGRLQRLGDPATHASEADPSLQR